MTTTTTPTLALYPIDAVVRTLNVRIDPIEWAYAHSLFPCSGLYYIPEIGYAFDQKALRFEEEHNTFNRVLSLDVGALQVLHVPARQVRQVEKPLDFYGLKRPNSEPVQHPDLDRAAAQWAADVCAVGETLTALEAAQQAQERRLEAIEAEVYQRAPAQEQEAFKAVYHPAVRGATPSDWFDMGPSVQEWLLDRLLEAGETEVRIPVLWEGWEAKVLEVAPGRAQGMTARSGTEWLRLFGVGTEG